MQEIIEPGGEGPQAGPGGKPDDKVVIEMLRFPSQDDRGEGVIAEVLGASHTAATRMVVENGKYTGEVEFYCYAEGKVAAIEKLAASEGYDLARCYAYSDSVTDLPMLSAVGHPTAVNPDRNLRREAVAKGWPILAFSNPVSLWARFQAPSSTTLAATAAVGLSALVAGAISYRLLRRRR